MINILDRVKFVFRKDKKLYADLYRILGFYPHNIDIYRQAFSHRSIATRNEKGSPINNERLEFLGDAVLGAAVSDILFRHFDRKREGFLTSTRSKIVSRDSLNKLANDLGIAKLVKSSAKNNTHNSYLGGNAFEALVGAIYLDRGYKTARWFIKNRIMGKLMDLDGVAKKEVNFKSKLLEWSQKNHIKSEFGLSSTENGNTNSPVFTSVISVEGIRIGEGTGYSKKESQQIAAKEALIRLRREPKLVEEIFAAKEKRTAMGAEEFSVLPQIEEIEEALKQEGGKQEERAPQRTQKPARKRSRRQSEKPETAESAEPSAPEETAAAPQPRPKRKPRTPKAEQPAAEQPETTDDAAETTEKKRRGRRRGPRRSPKAESEAAQQAEADKQREDIIRQAEEAAFGDQ